MDVNSVFGGATLKADDLQGREHLLTIASVEPVEFESRKGPQHKLKITFAGAKKPLICNKTNAKRIAMIHGNETTAWLGKQITLYPEIVDFEGEPTPSIRVKIVMGTRAVSLRPQARPMNDPMPDQTQHENPADGMNDAIPF